MERGEKIAGRYELTARLGRGGMGEVWSGRDLQLHRDVALKLLVMDTGIVADLPERFKREAVAGAQVNHPNVATLYDSGTHAVDVLYLVLELVKGPTLSAVISRESPMPPGRAMKIAAEICAALGAAHASGVIHYDVKPHNVMFSADGRVKVVDFGTAGFLQTSFSLARSSQLLPAGTPEYAAPEQLRAERGDERSDLYALGGVLFTMLAGRAPYTGSSAWAVLALKQSEEPPRLDSIRADLPSELVDLVAELLERNPSHRPRSAPDVGLRLARLLADIDATALEPGGPVITSPILRTGMTGEAERLFQRAETVAEARLSNPDKAKALAHLAAAVAGIDAGMAKRCAREADRAARDLASAKDRVSTMADVAWEVAASDPDLARGILADAEQVAREMTGFQSRNKQLTALAQIATALSSIDHDKAERLWAEVGDDSRRSLRGLRVLTLLRMAAVASSNPSEAAQLVSEATRIAPHVGGGIFGVAPPSGPLRALADIARVAAAFDPERARQLIANAEMLLAKSGGLNQWFDEIRLLAAIAAVDPPRAESMAREYERRWRPAVERENLGFGARGYVLAGTAAAIVSINPAEALRIVSAAEEAISATGVGGMATVVEVLADLAAHAAGKYRRSDGSYTS